MPTETLIRPTYDARQRIQSSAFVTAVIAGILLCICFMSSNLRRDKPLPQSKLDSRINPNYASQTSLMRLPGIGATGAAAIVAYREQFAQRNTGDVPFDNCADLDNVKGIGPKTAASLCESLKFD